ncbi:MAG: hypothetical protein PHT07_24735 [Paludibacter sp.]|nr:hypothetical protein [Paludibacter sp.]
MLRNFNKQNVLLVIVVMVLLLFVASTLVQTINLNNARADLSQTKAGLTAAQIELAQTQSEYTIIAADLARTKESLEDTRNSLAATKDQLDKATDELTITESELTSTKADLSQTQLMLANTEEQYERLTTGFGYVYNDPTYIQMMRFLNDDQIDKRTYDENYYNCYNFATDTANNAKRQNIRCGVVYIIYRSGAHAIIAFDTLDKGLLFFEPQSDEEVKLSIGEHYYQSIVPDPDHYYDPPAYDDTVLSFTISW